MNIYNVARTAMSVPQGVAAGVNSFKEHVQENSHAKADISQITLADLFHRKLYGFVDFDYVLQYLRDNHIAECKDMHTIRSLSREVVPILTEAALKDRDVKKVNALYTGVMRLCKRRRRGMLAYLSVEGHACVCLIKSWKSFLNYAGFSDTFTPESLVLDSEKVFPVLTKSRKIRSVLADVRDNSERKPEIINIPESPAISNTLNSNQSDNIAVNIVKDQEDNNTNPSVATDSSMESLLRERIVLNDNEGTALFKRGQDLDFAQLLAMNYSNFLNGTAVWDAEHACDTFIYFLYSKQYPELKNITTLGEFYNNIVAMFSTISFNLSESVLRHLSGGRLRDLRNALHLHSASVDEEIDGIFDNALMRLAENLMLSQINRDSSYREIYETERNFVETQRNNLLTKINRSDTIIAAYSDEQFRILCKYLPDVKYHTYEHNNVLFKDAYSKAVSGVIENFTDITGFDNIAMMLVYDAYHLNHMELKEFPSKFIAVLKNLEIADQDYWNSILEHTSDGVCLSLRAALDIPSVSNQKNNEAEILLKRAVAKFYSYNVDDTLSWQQVYLGTKNAKSAKQTSSITTASAADMLGIDLSDDIDPDTIV